MTKLKRIQYTATHRLIPTKYSGDPASSSVLDELPLSPDVLADLSELDAATNERTVAEGGGNPAIGPGELLYAVPEAHIVNAAFTHPGPYGGRFHGPTRGAWYAGIELETSVAEVAFHRRAFLKDARIRGPVPADYADFLVDFSGEFHFLTSEEKKSCLDAGPVPQCYAVPQALASSLLHAGSSGIVYPSVRRRSGTCICCFRPAMVFYPRRGQHYTITVDAAKSTHAYDLAH